jgi:DNA-binding NarL/FixJ family response regulator
MIPITLLMVEDHKLLRVGLKTLFEESNEIKVIAEADNGRDAIEKARTLKPDIVLLDIGLPDYSGIDIAKKILQNNQEQKIVILTSHLNEKEVIESLAIGVYAYVIKDINTDFLIMIIKSVNQGAIWLDSKIVPLIREKSNCFIPQKQTSRAAFRAQHGDLTEREYEVLKLVVEGQSNAEIANTLTISEHTAKAHVCNIIQKLVVDDRTQAAVKAIKEGLV